MLSRRSKLAVAVAGSLIAASVLLLAWWVMPRYRLWSSHGLRRGSEYAYVAPQFDRYVSVPEGSPEKNIRARFGKPTLCGRAGSAALERYVRARSRAGWSRPPRLAGKVLVYEVVSGNEMIVVYYDLDERGRLARAFVSET